MNFRPWSQSETTPFPYHILVEQKLCPSGPQLAVVSVRLAFSLQKETMQLINTCIQYTQKIEFKCQRKVWFLFVSYAECLNMSQFEAAS